MIETDCHANTTVKQQNYEATIIFIEIIVIFLSYWRNNTANKKHYVGKSELLGP